MKYSQNQLNQFKSFWNDVSSSQLQLEMDYSDDRIPYNKKGNKIHIKKENEGKFTAYCNGKVTNACIQKGKNSSDPKIRKRATFAANARTWNHVQKHQLGGLVKLARPLLRKVLSASKSVPEHYFDFNKNFYFAHATHPSNLQKIMNTGFITSARTLNSTAIPISNLEQVDNLLFKAINKGSGLHHNNQGLVFLEIPKRKGQTRFNDANDDLLEILTQSELPKFISTGQLPTRFNLFAVDGSRVF